MATINITNRWLNVAVSGATTLTMIGHHQRLIKVFATAALTLPTLSGVPASTPYANHDGMTFLVHADGGDVTLTPSGSDTVDGAAALTVPNGQWAHVVGQGAAWEVVLATDPSSLTWLSLSDTPATYQSGQIVVGNSAGTAVEFADLIDPTGTLAIVVG